ncbi:hypothetical protein BCR32DRAFT_277071 [Anaeromyces robustus]|uniref:Uncharacterized protein n=1 Tax=Anaeromyces robustus TaxID=1754192 RepID=A0A1Y1XFH8_9FUNG|nr:hypothetical protein BCR32DRAFT_277071 [Anaeromyces robustus]|eukprot:ORX84467.1 hypothetical protein BCR32DRAFT_277071 [Anaeromyces robustus]
MWEFINDSEKLYFLTLSDLNKLKSSVKLLLTASNPKIPIGVIGKTTSNYIISNIQIVSNYIISNIQIVSNYIISNIQIVSNYIISNIQIVSNYIISNIQIVSNYIISNIQIVCNYLMYVNEKDLNIEGTNQMKINKNQMINSNTIISRRIFTIDLYRYFNIRDSSYYQI